MDGILTVIAAKFGIDSATLVLLLGFLYGFAQLMVRLIPDDATGWKAGVRKIAKIIALYAPNQITSGVTVADVARGALAQGIKPLDKHDAAVMNKMGGE